MYIGCVYLIYGGKWFFYLVCYYINEIFILCVILNVRRSWNINDFVFKGLLFCDFIYFKICVMICVFLNKCYNIYYNIILYFMFII